MALTIEVAGNDLTAFLQDRSLSIKLASADMTFIDPSDPIACGDSVEITDPTWTGVVTAIESTGWKGDVPFIKVKAENGEVLADEGPAPFDLDDGPPANFKDLVVTRNLKNAIEEVRAKCLVFTDGLVPGMEIDVTSAVEGFTAETFTIMEVTAEFPVPDGPTWALDLGLGDYATATTGASDGGPLSPVTFKDQLIDTMTEEGCCDGGGGDDPEPGVASMIDDFTNRTVASTAGPYTSQELGTASGVAATWQREAVIDGTNTDMEVDPTPGVGIFSMDATSSNGQTLQAWQLPECLSGPGRFRMKWKTSYVGTGVNPTGASYVQWYLGDYDGSDSVSIWIRVSDNSGGTTFPGKLSLLADTTVDFAKTDWTADTYYYVDILVDEVAGEAKAKVWEVGDTEPDWQCEDTWTGSALAGEDTVIQFTNRAHTGGTAVVTVDYLQQVTLTTPAVGDRFCEIISHATAGTTWTTAYPYASGSMTALVDGTTQVPLETDPASGTFTFTFTVADDEQVHVCYRRA